MGETKTERFTGQDPSKGINRQPFKFNYAGLNWDFIRLLGEVAVYAAAKYGSTEQYANIRPEGEQSPLNHIMEHGRQYMAREPHDKFGGLEYHLAAIAYNAMMEFYYLTHGGPTVTDVLYRKEEELPWVTGEPGEVVELKAPQENISTLQKGKDLLTTFFGRHDAGKSEGSVSEAGN